MATDAFSALMQEQERQRVQAQTAMEHLANYIHENYQVQTRVSTTNTGAFVGIWWENTCVCTISSPRDFQVFQALCKQVAEYDEMRESIKNHEEDDLLEKDPNLDPTYAHRMLMREE